MRKEIEELMKECEEVIELCMATCGGHVELIKGLDDKSLMLLQKSLALYEKSKELSIKMAERMDEQDKKLDKIIALLEKKS